MAHFIGIDGGGTKTKCVLIGEDENILFQSEAGASNPLSVGFQNSVKVLVDLIKETNKKNKKTAFAVIGLAGAGRKNYRDELKQKFAAQLAKENILLKNFEIVPDSEAALYGAFNGRKGTILISGTGSIFYGIDNAGNIFRTGGFGKLIGDEGSGYSIGQRGLAEFSKQLDGRRKKTLLTKIFQAQYEITNQDELITKVYSNNFDIASAATLVIDAAAKGDMPGRKIIDDETDELLLHLKAAKKYLKEEKISLCFSGGLLTSKNYFSSELKRKINEKFINIKIIKPKHPPEMGAALLAKKFFATNL